MDLVVHLGWMRTGGSGSKKSENFADVICGRSQRKGREGAMKKEMGGGKKDLTPPLDSFNIMRHDEEDERRDETCSTF